MAGVVAKLAARQLLKGEFKKYKDKKPAGEYDPLFEMRPDRRGRMVKQKKLIPSYLSEEDAKILAKVRKRAYYLDMSLFNFMGVRFGWSSVIGIIPEIGDVIDMLMAMSLFRQCCKCGISSSTKMHMLMWIFIDFIIGLVPLVGDILDASIKANTKNVRLLEQELDRKYKPKEVTAEEKRLSRLDSNYRPPAPATVYEELSDDELPEYSTREQTPAGDRERHHDPRQPEPARHREERNGAAGHSKSWRKKEKLPDVERGERPSRR